MNERDFCLWLQGFAELSGAQPTQEQWQSIREHLATVFNKVTPPVKAAPPQLDSARLREIFDKAAKDRQKTPIIWPQYGRPPQDCYLKSTEQLGTFIC